jgi:hypothetical protein
VLEIAGFPLQHIENSISDDSVVSPNKEDNPHQIILLSTTSSAEKEHAPSIEFANECSQYT